MKKINILIFILVLVRFLHADEKNIALNKQVIGSFENLNLLTDGIIKDNNYTSVSNFKDYEQYFVIVLGQARYIDTITLYWIKGFEPKTYKIEIGKNLFSWDYTETFTFRPIKQDHNFVITSHGLKNTAGFFIKVTILKPAGNSVRISEVELSPTMKLNLKIMDSKVEKISEHTAEIIFMTSIPSTGYLRFGESKNGLNQNIGIESDIYSEHRIAASGLLKGTEYFYQPVVRDLNNNTIVGEIHSFKTKGIPLPKFENVIVENIGKFGCTLNYVYNIPCQDELYIGTEPKQLVKKFQSNKLSLSKKIKIEKLIPETRFYYKIIATDKFNNKKEYEGNFVTQSDNIALKKKVYGTFLYPVESMNADLAYLNRITDGDYNNNGIARSDNINDKDQSVIVDLNNNYQVRNVDIIWRGIASSRNFSLDISQDMKTWSTIQDKIDAKKKGTRILSQGEFGLFLTKVNIQCQGQEARYIRILAPKGSAVGSDLPFDPAPFLQLAEIEVYKIPDYGNPLYQIKEIK